ncbi:MAG: hypothetical protein ACYDG3_14940 [Bacillati bacterium]
MAETYCDKYRHGLIYDTGELLDSLDFHDTNNEIPEMILDVAKIQKQLANLLETIQICEERKMKSERLGPEEMEFQRRLKYGSELSSNRPQSMLSRHTFI